MTTQLKKPTPRPLNYRAKYKPHDGLASERVANAAPWEKELTGARCVGVADPEIFFPFTDEELEAAIEICSDCPIRAACYDIGTSRKDYGVYGGVYLEKGKPVKLPKDRRK